ncbi:hypothetical protein BO71DRAFT_429452 [Aspergillus ellipticus CBS 707.79]|uniref:HNH nuclease domain-containing protein n=1 Tax=Aspergillus ellipticus CBS 707.79 TaxID=1448320 RepID=A0A319DCB5_9EURO|nr:hypothetical protein BO71DRAFT_429452 [Aspergillus ellipticus CBS 707.79]
MSRAENPSHTVPSSVLSTSFEVKASLDATLEKYQALDLQATVKFLKVLFNYLPLDGQRNLAEDVFGCQSDAEIRQLADCLDTGFLRPMLSIAPFPRLARRLARRPCRLAFDDSMELNASDLESATENEQQQLRRNCLSRDGYQCVVTKIWDRDSDHPPELRQGSLLAAHIIPFSFGRFQSDDDREQTSLVWGNIFRFFPSLRSHVNLTPGDVNREDNVIAMLSAPQEEFVNFRFVLEAPEIPGHYRLKTFPGFSDYLNRHFPHDNIVVISHHHSHFGVPRPEFLDLHAAIRNILNDSGKDKVIEKLLYDFRDTGALARDGSTNIGGLLSVSQLSVLASDRVD